MQPPLLHPSLLSVQQEHYELLFWDLFLYSIERLCIFQRKKKVLHIIHLAKHSLMAADLHKNCVSIHCAPIKVNCNLFIISLNLIYCKMNSIYRCSNSCANHSSSHWTRLCFWATAAVAWDQRTLLNFLKRWPCLLHTGQARVAPQSSPCKLLALAPALWRKLAPYIPSTFNFADSAYDCSP